MRITELSKRELIERLRRLQQRITELEGDTSRDTEAEVRRERDLLSRIMETSPSGILVLDPSGTIVFANAAAERVIGLQRDTIIGRRYDDPMWDITGYDGAPLPDEAQPFRKVMETRCPTFDEPMAIRSVGGHRILLSVNAAPLLSEDGEVERIVLALEDVTSRVCAHEALRDSEERFRRMAESIRDGLAIIEEGRIVYVNDRFCEILGYPRDELMGKTSLDFAVEEERERIARIISDVKGGKGELQELEYWIQRKDGVRRYIHNSYSISRTGGRMTGRYIVTSDITERKQLEEQLRQSQKMEAIGNLAGGIAHDFNNLLTAIGGYSDLLLASIDENDPRWRDCAEIKKAAERATALTGQLLAFSRRQVLQPKVLDLNRVVDEMKELLGRLIGEDIELVTDLAVDLNRIMVDPGQIQQVIMNLAINARDAMMDGGILTIRTENVTLDENMCRTIPDSSPGEFVHLSIEDTGVGMSGEVLARVFDPFFSTKEAGEGTGLGLSTVYGIVKQHHGSIAVSSEPGGGAAFSIYLPSYHSELEEHPAGTGLGDDLRGNGERILIVEDDEGVRGFISRVLSDHGYTVFETDSAEGASTVFEMEGGAIDLVFTDVVLPKRTGLQLVEELASQKQDIRVVLSSGYSSRKIAQPLIEKHGYRLLRKPFTAVDLLQAIKEVLHEAPA
ncbi:MAG: PAS domain S-box protein [bacterium]|nr:MAG: PAS domain S-box protein [bacterium]